MAIETDFRYVPVNDFDPAELITCVGLAMTSYLYRQLQAYMQSIPTNLEQETDTTRKGLSKRTLHGLPIFVWNKLPDNQMVLIRSREEFGTLRVLFGYDSDHLPY